MSCRRIIEGGLELLFGELKKTEKKKESDWNLQSLLADQEKRERWAHALKISRESCIDLVEKFSRTLGFTVSKKRIGSRGYGWDQIVLTTENEAEIDN